MYKATENKMARLCGLLSRPPTKLLIKGVVGLSSKRKPNSQTLNPQRVHGALGNNILLFSNLLKWPKPATLNEQKLHDAVEHKIKRFKKVFKLRDIQGHRKQNGTPRRIAIKAPH